MAYLRLLPRVGVGGAERLGSISSWSEQRQFYWEQSVKGNWYHRILTARQLW